MNTLTIIVIALIAACMIIGAIRGFVKSALGLIFSVVSLVVAYMLVPFVGIFIVNNTGIDEYVEEKVKLKIENEIEDRIKKDFFAETGMDIMSVDPGLIDVIKTEVYANDPNKNEQIDIIKSLGFTEGFTNSLIENNNDDEKNRIGAVGFYDYIAKYIGYRAANLVAYVITFFTINIIFAVLTLILKLAVKLPVLNGLNRLGGALLGAVLGLVIVWAVFVLFESIPGQDICVRAVDQINESSFLTFIQEKNIFTSMMKSIK
ncbi:MAG: CvpA family protein [Lachnospiraceae bacterium]|nr:CvpA family protein [Lachnospiraceae bacterium]